MIDTHTMKSSLRILSVVFILIATEALTPRIHTVSAQQTSTSSVLNTHLADSMFAGLKMRSIGPAFMSGRIADIAIHPTDPSIWYVAVGSGGVWKTINSGNTWTPVFDDQSSYSIGCVTIDANNPNVIWIGTGENVGGRHVGFGDGVYRSDDGGNSWTNMGLKESQHISKIIVHPDNSNIVWVAAQGPLWNSGGERGLYLTKDGGSTWWKAPLGDNEWTGVTDILIDPRNPDLLYAATWQRHRTVAAYMGGGPGSGIHRSTDGGLTWTKLKGGLPSDSNIGKIGLAISPQHPDVVYAAIELDRRMGGLYRSNNRGASWTKMSNTVSGATGPHYYQELYASPHKFDQIFLVDNAIQISDNGGKSFVRMNTANTHGDYHAIAFRNDDPDYLLIGSDGGVFETEDNMKAWRYMANLPLTQFYKVSVDDALPFYNIYGGTQDNGTQGGPSRTDNVHGIRNTDWRLVLDWDGHGTATEPGNPDIVYAERQEGALARIDVTTGEPIDIQPQPGADEGHERFNWDAPIHVSPHSPTRLYFASHRLWRSDNRGDSWTTVSGDLTRNLEPIEQPIMGRAQSWDNPWDLLAMSDYSTITSISESPLVEGLIYIGTDDGLIQVTEDGGASGEGSWRAVGLGDSAGRTKLFPNLPATAFVNDIKADLHEADVVYAVFDNHKFGDIRPYIYKSSDRGRTWKSIVGNLPERTLTWRIIQDHVDPNLLFAGTEFGVYFTVDGGTEWMKLAGTPTISFRDLTIQRRENDLVAASFGRGFYVLDDYSALRNTSAASLQKATLFKPRDAWWYTPRAALSFYGKKGSQGDDLFVAPNPPFGTELTYYLPSGFTTKAADRKKNEGELKDGDIPFPGWDALEAEARQSEPRIWLTVKNEDGAVVRRVRGPIGPGFHRVAWDLRYPAATVVRISPAASATSIPSPDSPEPAGNPVAPGTFTVSLSSEDGGVVTALSGPQSFEVKPMRSSALQGASHQVVADFWRSVEDVQRLYTALQLKMQESLSQTAAMKLALQRATTAPGSMDKRIHDATSALYDLDRILNGPVAKRGVGARTVPTIGTRLGTILLGVEGSTYGPTQTHREQLAIVQQQLGTMTTDLNKQRSELSAIAELLVSVGAPLIEGASIPDGN